MLVVPIAGNVALIVDRSFVVFVLLAAVIYAVVVPIVTGFHIMLLVPISGNVARNVDRSFVASFILLAAVVYAVVTLVVTGLHIVVFVPIAWDVTCAFVCVAGAIAVAISSGRLYTSVPVVLRWADRPPIIIRRLVAVMTRVPRTATGVVGVVLRLFRFIRVRRRIPNFRRLLVRLRSWGNLRIALGDSRRFVGARNGAPSGDHFFGSCKRGFSFDDRTNRSGLLVYDSHQKSVWLFTH